MLTGLKYVLTFLNRDWLTFLLKVKQVLKCFAESGPDPNLIEVKGSLLTSLDRIIQFLIKALHKYWVNKPHKIPIW